MSSDRKQTRDEILAEALDLPPVDWPAFLSRVCKDDAALRDEVERLLSVHQRMESGFMGGSAVAWVVPKFDRGHRIGRYEIESQMSSGGMSVVYRAIDTGIGRSVAIKVLLPSGEENAASSRRFLAEVRTLGSIRHPNVVQIFDFGEMHGLPYIVMECLEGEDLAMTIAGGRCGDFKWKLDIAKQLAAALEHVHKAGIIHRDIKPANVFIERSGMVKLMDFGIARSGQPRGTHATALIGTPEYLPPEQVKGERATQRSDIYSYGILLFELFTGKKPYLGNTAELLYKIVHEDIPIDVLRNTVLPKALTRLICCATDKNPSHRPSSFQQVVEALEALEKQPRNESITFAWDGRKKAAAAILVAVSFGAVLSVGQLSRGDDPLILPMNPIGTPRPPDSAFKLSAKITVPPQATEPTPLIHPAIAAPLPAAPMRTPLAPATAPPSVNPPNANDSHEKLAPVDTSPASSRAAADTTQEQDASRSARVQESPIAPVQSDLAKVQPPNDPPRQDVRAMQLEARTAAAAKILTLLKNYSAAFGSKNLNAVESLRDLTAEQRRRIAETFAHNLRVEMMIVPVSDPQFDELAQGAGSDLEPHKAVISVDVTIRLRVNNGEVPPPARPRVSVGLTRIGQTWRISSWE